MKIGDLKKSFHNAIKGLQYALRHEQNIRIHSIIAISVIVVGWYIGISKYEWLSIIIVITLVMSIEIVNSGIESLADVLKPRLHAQIGMAKDIMAAAVLFSSCGALLVGFIIFVPYIIELLVQN